MAISLIVDNPKRDLDGILLIAYHLLRQGVVVYITPMYQQGYELPMLAPEVVLSNYARLNNRDLLVNYSKAGIKVAVLDTEGGLLSEHGQNSPGKWVERFQSNGFDSIIDKYFLWGERLLDAFRESDNHCSKQFVVTGCPRYDMCISPWSRMLDYSEEGYVLVNTNFPIVNPAYSKSSKQEFNASLEIGYKETYVQALHKSFDELFLKYIQTLYLLAQSNSNILFVIRPHPFEDAEYYRKKFKLIANVKIDPFGNVLNQIHNAACIVHLNCSTAIESNLLSKVPISLEFLNNSTFLEHSALPSKISCPAQSYQDLNILIRDEKIREVKHNFDKTKQYIYPWFYKVDGQAAQRLASSLLSLLNESSSLQPKPNWLATMQGSRTNFSLLRYLQGFLALTLGTKITGALRCLITPSRKSKSIRLKDIQARIKKFAEVQNEPISFQAHYAKNPISKMPLTTIKLVPD
ncbi:MAG: hypothetical protein F6J87_01385 [Spirulina sp. SIO3F2]|nr:hypothetical protein [Spirulina sp. SIO3F2]